ncbi:MAG: HNH endonuclease [Sedimenticolaceae bacterium]
MPNPIVKHRQNAFNRQQGRCYYCGMPMWQRHPEEVAPLLGVKPRTVSGLQCTAEHLVARQDGGTNTKKNIAAACRTCNGRRHKATRPLSPPEYRQKVQGRVKAGKWHPAPIRRLGDLSAQ